MQKTIQDYETRELELLKMDALLSRAELARLIEKIDTELEQRNPNKPIQLELF